MEGFIKIENVTREGREGVCVEGQLRHVSAMDKFHILHCVCRALHISQVDLMVFNELEKLQIWEEETEVDAERPDTVEKILDGIFGGHHEG